MKINSQNLKRYVPTAVREAVRKRCGFGCVICGAAWYDYEHFDPDFKDAKEHNSEGITLLCMQHNQRRARGTLSVETVRAANADPICKKMVLLVKFMILVLGLLMFFLQGQNS